MIQADIRAKQLREEAKIKYNRKTRNHRQNTESKNTEAGIRGSVLDILRWFGGTRNLGGTVHLSQPSETAMAKWRGKYLPFGVFGFGVLSITLGG